MGRYVNQTKAFVLLLTAALVLSGCALIVHGKRQELTINTEPPGLTAIAAGKSCITPCTLKVSRKNERIKLIRADGTDLNCELNRTFNFWTVVVGNAWNYIFPGLIIDIVSGAAYTIEDVDIALPQKDVSK